MIWVVSFQDISHSVYTRWI